MPPTNFSWILKADNRPHPDPIRHPGEDLLAAGIPAALHKEQVQAQAKYQPKDKAPDIRCPARQITIAQMMRKTKGGAEAGAPKQRKTD